MKPKTNAQDAPRRSFNPKQFWRHYVATVDTDDAAWRQEQGTEQDTRTSRIFMFLLLFHAFLIAAVVLYNLVSDRPKPVFVDTSIPSKNPAPAPSTGSGKSAAPPAIIPATKEPEIVDHRVTAGDSLKSIADRSGTSQDEIARMNHIDVNTPLAVGSVLRVPKPKSVDPAPAVTPAMQPGRVRENLFAVQPTTAPGAAEMFRAEEPGRKNEGQKPAATAAQTLTPAADKLPEEKLKPKSSVEDSPPKDPASKPAAKTAPTEKPAASKTAETAKPAPAKTQEPAKPAPAKASGGTYTVKPKETFYSIARKNGVNVDELMKINGITDPGKLREGTVLKLPAK